MRYHVTRLVGAQRRSRKLAYLVRLVSLKAPTVRSVFNVTSKSNAVYYYWHTATPPMNLDEVRQKNSGWGNYR